MLERLFWDIAEFIESTDFIEDFCATIQERISDRPKKNSSSQSPKKSHTPPKNTLEYSDKKNQSYNYQFASTYFDKGKFRFDTLSMNLRECLRKYKREVYDLLKCRNYYLHKFKINFYLLNDNYLEFLKSKLDGYGNEFIRLRFCYDKLTITLKRDINNNIRCFGNVLDVLKRFLLFGFKELYALLESFDISRESFERNIRAKTYTHYHLAKDINQNILKIQEGLSNRLKLNQMNNNKESLANIGLKYHVHYIDFSRYDEYGYKFPEYEIECKYPNGVSYAELKRDLSVLEPDIRPKEQTTIDKYLKNDLFNDLRDYIKEYNKKHVHGIRPFSIKNNPIKNGTSNFERNIYEINEFNNMVIDEPIHYTTRIVKDS